MALGQNLDEKLAVIDTMFGVLSGIKDVYLPELKDKDEIKNKAFSILKRELDSLL